VVTYNYFNQPATITEGEYLHTFSYNAHQQRSMMSTTKNGTATEPRYYINKYYEKEKTGPRTELSYNYIYGDYGVVGLYVMETPDVYENSAMYYIHTDHLGSYCAISTDSANVVQRNIFDPWGNHFYFDSQGVQDTLPGGGEASNPRGPNLLKYHFNLTRRGFTGHEHYPELKIINMNGRLYDPVIGRFFSPDNFVQENTSTQDFNRYSYARNCPLKYTDPTGWRYVDGEYRDWHGKYLGWDGINDDNVFIVDDNKSTKIIKQNEKRGLTTDASSVTIALKTTLTELRESMNVLQRTIDNGGFKEESSVVTHDGRIFRGSSGAFTTSGIATAELPIVPGNNNTSIHSHLTGETATGWWLPFMGPGDPRVFSNYQRNIIVGKFAPEGDAVGGHRKSGAVFYDRNSKDPIGTLYSDPIYKILGGRK
jgi:RHS repeat-associated protein